MVGIPVRQSKVRYQDYTAQTQPATVSDAGCALMRTICPIEMRKLRVIMDIFLDKLESERPIQDILSDTWIFYMLRYCNRIGSV
jgi:hypothetical protein